MYVYVPSLDLIFVPHYSQTVISCIYIIVNFSIIQLSLLLLSNDNPMLYPVILNLRNYCV